MREHLQRIHELLARRPRLRPLLERVCIGLNRRGAPTGTLKLGDTLDRVQELEPLRLLFDRAVTESRQGVVTLNFNRLAETAADAAALDAFFQALHTAVGVPRANLPAQRRGVEQETENCLARLRLLFPAFPVLHDALAARAAYWRKRVAEDGAAAVQPLLEGVFRVAHYLEEPHPPMTVSDLGARLFGDSKILRGGELQTLAGDFLARLDQPEAEPDPAARAEAWRRRNIVSNPSAIKLTLFGPLVYWKNGREFDWIYRLWQDGETATLSQGNLAGIERCELRNGAAAPLLPITTCENESPFCRLAQQREPGVILYTEGYPNAAVVELLRLLRPLQLPARHWGDSDLDGLRIAERLNRVHPLALWRCDLPELQRLQPRLKPLPEKAQATARQYLRTHPDFTFAAELTYTLQHGWLEQEAWHG